MLVSILSLRSPPPRRQLFAPLLAVALLSLAAYPYASRWREARRIRRVLDQAALAIPASDLMSAGAVASRDEIDAALLVRVATIGPMLASWQTLGGCGAGAATGGAGIKWIGRGVSGGLFNVLEQASYTQSYIGMQRHLEQHMVENSLITLDLGGKWNAGVNVPLIYKYLVDPRNTGVDVSNGGLGDVSVQLTRKLGDINDTTLTGVVGLPTGTHDARYKGRLLEQHQQLGFGRFTGSLILDHIMDRGWGLIVLGGLGSYRGGENDVQSYRAPSTTAYAYSGYYLGPFVPSIGLSVSKFFGHDRSVNEVAATALFNVAANASIEWATSYFAVLAGATIPYQYDGLRTQGGIAKSPWGLGAWSLGLGLACSPF